MPGHRAGRPWHRPRGRAASRRGPRRSRPGRPPRGSRRRPLPTRTQPREPTSAAGAPGAGRPGRAAPRRAARGRRRPARRAAGRPVRILQGPRHLLRRVVEIGDRARRHQKNLGCDRNRGSRQDPGGCSSGRESLQRPDQTEVAPQRCLSLDVGDQHERGHDSHALEDERRHEVAGRLVRGTVARVRKEEREQRGGDAGEPCDRHVGQSPSDPVPVRAGWVLRVCRQRTSRS